jgi:hypothetical protein
MINQIEATAIKGKKAISFLLAFSVTTALALIGINQASDTKYTATKNDDDTNSKKYGIIPNVMVPNAHAAGVSQGGCGGEAGGGCGGGDGGGDGGDGGGCGGCGCCFLPTTQVQTPDGPVAISQLTVDQIVTAYDEVTQEYTTATVAQVLRHGEAGVDQHDFNAAPLLELQHEQGKLIVTANHPIYDTVTATFKPAGDFEVGNTLLTQTQRVSITGVTELEEAEHLEADKIVYNLTLTNGPHTYIADGIVVHNKGDGSDCF